jgi:hypothetical protein
MDPLPIAPGTRLGPYEISALLGMGGMGEVYRATDTRLGRAVAIKVLPPDLSGDPDRLRRFEQEARAVGGLNHPNLVTLFDVGEHDGRPYLVMELLEGETLRLGLTGGPLHAKRATEFARGIAEGLAAAHGRGVIHRDLKPENIFLTTNGLVKILDFGLAKLRSESRVQEALSGEQPTPQVGRRTSGTAEGLILGTVGYMSPEQVRGDPVDARSDLFALGIILWEMLTGARPFQGPSPVETMWAVVKDEPPELKSALNLPATLERIVRSCLAKNPAERFHSAHDLAFHLGDVFTGPHRPFQGSHRNSSGPLWWASLAALVALAVGVGLGGWALGDGPPALPSFQKLTFGRGAIDSARFVPGSTEIVYSARWQGSPSTVFLLRAGVRESQALETRGAVLLGISAQGDVAVLTQPVLYSGLLEGIASIVPLAGGGTREISRVATAADFGPDESSVCLVTRVSNATYQLEWPQGEVLLVENHVLAAPRVRGSEIALFRSKDEAGTEGEILVVAKGQRPRALVSCKGFTSLAWGPDGREIWYSTYDGGESRIQAATLSGGVRILARHAGRLELKDVGPGGRALAIVSSHQRQAFGRAPGAARDIDLTWLDAQAPMGLSSDGSHVLLAHFGDWNMSDQTNLYLRPTDGGPAIKIGVGSTDAALSPDGRWVGTFETDAEGQIGFRVIPTGAGAARLYPLRSSWEGVWFDPMGGRVFLRDESRHSISGIDLATGAVTPDVVPPSVNFFSGQNPFSPDGRRMLFGDFGASALADGHPARLLLFEGESTKPRPAPGNLNSEAVAGWDDASAEVYLYNRNAIPAEVVRWNPVTGARRPFLQVTPPDASGVWGIQMLRITPSGRAYAYSIIRRLSDLYLIEGLK